MEGFAEVSLSRYSAPFTVFRELVQNANDAGANTVEITFICGEPSATNPHVLPEGAQPPQKAVDDEDSGKGVMSTAIRVRNDGRPFSKDDWNRLKKIAEGNPDENKVGMFGVGFYSLFSVCEEPFVSSAGECIAFYWKGDQLFAKRAAAPVEIDDGRENPWTTFFMVLRGNRVEVPDIDGDGGFGAFLATNLGFTSSLRSVIVDLQIGNSTTRLFAVTKAVSEPRPMSLPPGLRTVSPCKMLRLSLLDVCQVQMEAAYLIMPKAKPKSGAPAKNTGLISIGSFGGRVGNGLGVFLRGIAGIAGGSSKVQRKPETVAGAILDERSYATSAAGGFEKPKPHTVTERIFVRVARGHLVATLDKAWCAEFARTAKKQPPAQPMLQIIYTGHDEMEASTAPQRDTSIDFADGAGSFNPKVKSDESIFRDLIPYPQQGRIFIGFPTFQTTGNNLHLSSHLIPTVERESIDLIDRCLAVW